MKTKTYQPKAKDVKRNWRLMDAKGKVLGRIATEIAKILMGKDKVDYSTHMDMGDNVVVINASEVVLTGNKANSKVYRSHSGFPGGFKEVKFSQMKAEMPTRIIEKAVYGMIPTNRLTSKRMARLKVFEGSEHNLKVNFLNKD